MKRIVVLLALLICLSSLPAQKKDFLLSLVVPGSSQIAQGKTKGYAMLVSEAALLGTIYYMKSESSLKTEEAYLYAIKHANIVPGNYDEGFLRNLGKYMGSGFEAMGYNSAIRSQAIAMYPNDPVAQQAYIDQHAYGEENYWKWDSAEDKSHYNSLRNKSLDFRSIGNMTIGVVMLNHIISGLDALISGNKARRTDLDVTLLRGTPLVRLSYEF
ncbi:MAG: hypothetical protein GX106_07535 [Candidatus Cloacimonetes bacterium]|nr:hypothetical protein [Candidatus Cloacimonadota bacterium]